MIVNEVDVIVTAATLAEAAGRTGGLVVPAEFQNRLRGMDLCGRAHHTGFSQAVRTEHLRDFAEIANIELAVIDSETKLEPFRESLRNAEIYYHLASGLGRM